MSDLSDLHRGGNALIVQPHPFSTARIDGLAPAGRTLLQIVELAELPAPYLPHVRIWVDGWEVPRGLWATARPRAGRVVYLKVLPGKGGSGGKNPLATVLSLALIVAAPWVAGFALTGTWGVSAATLGFEGAVATVAVNLVGSMAINALVPPAAPSPGGAYGQTTPVYQITGTSNTFQPYAAIPRVFGRTRLYPMMAARPYTESQGNDRYVRLLLLAGYGPLAISDIKIGETPITAFSGVEIEVTEGGPPGWAGNTDITLYTQAIHEDDLTVALTASSVPDNDWQSRTTQFNTSEVSLDISFPSGLITYAADGSQQLRTVSCDVRYRLVGDTAWTTPDWTNATDPGMDTPGVITASETSQSAVMRSGRFLVAAAGQYEVECRRTTATGSDHDVDSTVWSALRSIQHETPVTQPQVCLIAIRIKASAQLNGTPNTINCLAESYLPVWDGNTWTTQLSRNNAWAYAEILRHRGAETLIADNRIDLAALQAWAAACDATAPNAAEPYWTYDNVIEGGSVFTALRDIAAHGRAAYTMKDGKHSVVMDSAQTVPVQHITPRNSWGYSGSKQFLDLPHALNVKFTNEDKGYVDDQVTVYADGYTEMNATVFETVEYYGCKRANQAWRIGRYLLAVGKLRPEEHTVYMDIESLRCTNGDLVRFNHDVILVGLGAGRIKSLTVDAGNNVTNLALDGPIEMVAGSSYGMRSRKSDGSSVVMALVTVAGAQSAVTLVNPIPVALAPAAGDLFQFGTLGMESAPMLVKKIERGPDFTAKITMADAQDGVWTADSGVIPAFNSYITVQTPQAQRKPATPTFSLRSDDTAALVLSDGSVQNRIAVVIDPPAPTSVAISDFEVQYKPSLSSTWLSGGVASPDLRTLYLSPVLRGIAYDVRARADAYGVLSDWATTGAHVVVGKTQPPSDVASVAAIANGPNVQLTWPGISDRDWDHYQVREGTQWDAARLVADHVLETTLLLSNVAGGLHSYLVKAVDTSGNSSVNAATVAAQVSATSDPTAPAATIKDATVTVDAIGNAVITFEAIQEPQITGYELRSGATFETGTTLASTTGNTITLPVLSLSGLTLWIKGVYAAGYTAASYKISFSSSALSTLQGLSWRVSEPDIVFSWGAAAGAAQYVALFEDGGVTRVQVVGSPTVSFPIPKWTNAVFRVFAIAADGGESPYADVNISLTGVYNYNEIVNISLPITSGQYINMAYTASNQVRRVGLLGADPVAPYFSGINDSDFYAFGFNLWSLPSSALWNTPSSWFRDKFWREKNGFFESGVLDLGAVLSGKLLVNLTKTVTNAGDGPSSAFWQVNSGYLGEYLAQEIMDTKAFVSVRLLVASDSPESGNWMEVQNGDWVTEVRYVKLVAAVTMAGPLTDITITAGAITLDVPDVSEVAEVTGVTNAGKAVTFQKTYHVAPMVMTGAAGAVKSWADPASITVTGCTLYTDSATPTTVTYFAKRY